MPNPEKSKYEFSEEEKSQMEREIKEWEKTQQEERLNDLEFIEFARTQYPEHALEFLIEEQFVGIDDATSEEIQERIYTLEDTVENILRNQSRQAAKEIESGGASDLDWYNGEAKKLHKAIEQLQVYLGH